jgi:mRNA interferase ChpB
MVKRKNGFDRGDIVFVDFNPSVGHEQREGRPALVLSPKLFNDLGMAFVAPITQGGGKSRHDGFTVAVSGTGLKTQGVVLLSQARMIDLVSRHAKFVEKADEVVVTDALMKFSAIID